MTLVVADTSPICYLILIQAIELLPRLYTRIVLPPEVVAELNHPRAPSEVQNWASKLPKWVDVISANLSADPLADIIDAGEAAAIRVAQQISAELILIDDFDARQVAASHGLKFAGTIGILESAAAEGLVDLRTEIEKLRGTNFRMNNELVKQALARDAARRK
jgi:predicted nucleic acid-binding protein